MRKSRIPSRPAAARHVDAEARALRSRINKAKAQERLEKKLKKKLQSNSRTKEKCSTLASQAKQILEMNETRREEMPNAYPFPTSFNAAHESRVPRPFVVLRYREDRWYAIAFGNDYAALVKTWSQPGDAIYSFYQER